MDTQSSPHAAASPRPASNSHHDLVYGLDARPPLPQTIFAALQHMLAMFVGIITPPLIIANALETTPAVLWPEIYGGADD